MTDEQRERMIGKMGSLPTSVGEPCIEVNGRLWKKSEIEKALAERDKLQAFKDWVHTYLDTHNVPHHPPGVHGAAGCRIGDRMDWLMSQVQEVRMSTESKPEIRDSWDDVLSGKIHELIRVADWAAIVGYGLIRDKLKMVIAELEQIKRMRSPKEESHEQDHR